MPDSHIIIIGCLSEMMGNATNGRIFDLKTAVTALHNVIEVSDDPPEGSEELMEEIHQWACEGGTYEMGASSQAKDYIDRCNQYL